MNVLLIEPPAPTQPVAAFDSETGGALSLAPSWNLLCLRSYLLEHTRHFCQLVDCRLFADLETELVEAMESGDPADFAVINTTSLGVGQAAAVLEIIKRRSPRIRTVVCGQHPSQFPDHVSTMPRVDFALAGDPEPVLRNLLDYVDVEQRMRRIPGLILAGGSTVRPYWLDDLRSLSLPDWQGVFWPAYRSGPGGATARVYARLSRGHSGVPADRACGDAHEPLRLWALDRMATALQKAGHKGVTEVSLNDPPGIWTPERLNQWCAALRHERNVQPWSIQLFPTLLDDDTMDLLQITLCRRVEFVFPSCDPAILRWYGCILPPRDMAATLSQLEQAGIQVRVRFWIGGPEERPGEEARATRMIRATGFRPYSLHPFPFRMDAPIYQDFQQSASTHVDDWVAWSRDPWIMDRPVPLWGGQAAAPRLTAQFESIRKSVQRSPSRVLTRMVQGLRPRSWIAALEDKAIGMLAPPAE